MIKKILELVYYYCVFHKGLEKYKDKLVILTFSELTNNPRDCLSKINNQFSTNLNTQFDNETITETIPTDIKKRNLIKVGFNVRQLAIPSKEKAELQEKILPRVEEHKDYQKALRLYNSLVSVNFN